MATTVGDFKIAGVAAGFTLGYGFLTVWKAIKQTSVIRAPHRSTYVYLMWGEIVANLAIGIIGWLFLEGVIPLGVPVLFSLLFCWVFEIQLLMQIIINRVFVVAENKQTVIRVKWITAGIITAINIAVFCIWIPAHLNPPANAVYPVINKYWDRTSKVLICIVDAALNYWFLRIVQRRLVRYHGLKKYAPLVNFNAWLMALSVGMDVMLIGLMSLRNQLVYIQFHPVTYMVKLNIEMTMAAMITKLARESGTGDATVVLSSSQDQHRHNWRADLQMSDIELNRCAYQEEARQNQSHIHRPGHKHKESDGLAGINKETTIHVMTQHAFPNKGYHK
ncbi:hypothetical protein BGW36DRAFT_56907 [Talaromyces proteolyticus]|uniref:Uncharacterized protein n=1 Tax=Talaromyces proteolyticus TaxID=1131652 RepID=A0AAD4KEN2_9EURO|nr:uncharacterized protein BGW36DRAFT_56907 [Talaromyces proteolyticus]KAH8690524.1 hypothetical protein BGW36DRAFT_56907 [Talaromyces proteolyticus]